MNKEKWNFQRGFAVVLALSMLLMVSERPIAAVVSEENTIVYEEIVDLGETQTLKLGMSFLGTEEYVLKKDGNQAEWIDRIQISEGGRAFYDTLVEAVDNDGIADFLIDKDYYSDDANAENIKVFNYSSGSEICNVVEYASVSNTEYEFDFESIYAEIRAVYDAFVRDYPEVFWLSGRTSAAASISYNGSIYTATFYFILKSQTEDFDVRATEYQVESVLKTAILQRDSAIDSIIGDEDAPSSANKLDWIKYFNSWLTKNNAYCTELVDGTGESPALSHECISALIGSEGSIGPVCEGYAKAFKVLCKKKNIPCVLVDGNATSDGISGGAHMWNYVQVDGEWYAVDVTWNDPYVSSGVAVSGYENEDWLLLGENTVVTYPDLTFIQSHPVSNQASYNGVQFTNGPKLSPTEYVEKDYTIGDANGDGQVNVRDVILVRKYIVDKTVEIDILAADVVEDGRINVRDVIELRKIIIN